MQEQTLNPKGDLFSAVIYYFNILDCIIRIRTAVAQRLSTRPTSKAGKRTAKKSKKIRQDDNIRLSVEDKQALKEVMTGKADITRYGGEEYLKKLKAEIN